MDTDQAYTARLEAQMRAVDARFDELEAAARARNAQDEMDAISGLRTKRDRFRQQLADAKRQSRTDLQAARSQMDSDFQSFRRALADVQTRYSAWDDAREQRFNAHLNEADAALRRSAAEDASIAADERVRISKARDELKAKLANARSSYDTWRQRRTDEAFLRNLDRAEFALQDAFDDYAVALAGVIGRATG